MRPKVRCLPTLSPNEHSTRGAQTVWFEWPAGLNCTVESQTRSDTQKAGFLALSGLWKTEVPAPTQGKWFVREQLGTPALQVEC